MPYPYLGGKQWQPDVRQQRCQLSLPGLHVMPHPLHQSMKNGLFVGHINVITAQQLGNFISWKQEEFLVLYDINEVFLEKKGFLL